MKVLVALLTALLAGSIGSTVFAQMVVEMNQNGEYRLAISADHWEISGVNIADEAQNYIGAAKKAKESPGKFFPVVTREVPKEMVGPFDLKKDLVAYSGVIYDSEHEEVVMVNDPTILSSSVVFSPFLIYWAFALVAMLLLNIRYSHREAPIYDVSASMAAVLGLMLALYSAGPIIPRLSTLLFFASIVPVALVVGKQEEKQKGIRYWCASIVIYVTLAVLLPFAYTSTS